MNHEFPQITNISQFDYLRDEPEFIFKEEGDTIIIFYAVAFPHTFGDLEKDPVDAMLRRECRGIVFNTETGDIVSRPYHKFFNLNEREETQEQHIDFSKDHIFLDKCDGSMIRPVICDGELRLFTKAGLSDVALEAEELGFTDRIKHFCRGAVRNNVTPIFEYVGSPKYPIVLKYDQPKLILTAIRYNDTGMYMNYVDIPNNGRINGIDLVSNLDVYDVKTALELKTEIVDAEGWVIRFDNGHMLKIKGDWYLRRHSAKEKILVPRKLVKLILENDLDDVMPDLSQKEQDYVTHFSITLEHNIKVVNNEINLAYLSVISSANLVGLRQNIKMDQWNATADFRKEFARFARESKVAKYTPFLFKILDSNDINILDELLIADIIKSCGKDRTFEKYSLLIED